MVDRHRDQDPVGGEDFGADADLSMVQADDALLDFVGQAGHDVDDQLAGQDQGIETLLAEWRREIDTEPHGELVDTDTAMAAIAAGEGPSDPAPTGGRRRKLGPRFLVPVAGAAAIFVVSFAGVGIAARDAQPGDPLWGLTQVLYTEHARSVQAESSARDALKAAEHAWRAGRTNEAEAALQRADNSLDGVSSSAIDRLRDKHSSLETRLHPSEVPPTSSSSTTSIPVSTPDQPPVPVPTHSSESSTTKTPSPPPTTSTTVPQPPTTTSQTTNPTQPPTTSSSRTPNSSTSGGTSPGGRTGTPPSTR